MFEVVDLTPKYQHGYWCIGTKAITHEDLLKISNGTTRGDWRITLHGLEWTVYEIKSLVILIDRLDREEGLKW